MSDRQNAIYSDSPARKTASSSLDGLIDDARPKHPFWRLALLVVPLGGTLLTIAAALWVNFGHLYLQPRFTFPIIFGIRQGLTTGQTELSAAPNRAAATNIVNAGTAVSEGRKQAIITKETTGARATQNAQIQAETIRETARIQAAAQCIGQIRSAAAMKRADCIGTGVAGGQCEARGDLIEILEAKCGSLEANEPTANSGDMP